MNADASIQLVSYGDDPLRYLARLLHERHQDRLPDLSRQVVLFPHTGAIPRFRRILLKQAAHAGYAALLPPYIGMLSAWARRHASENQQPLSETAREILLRDLLGEIPAWSHQYDAWPLVDSLLTLFDELTLQRCQLPDEPDRFLLQIAKKIVAEMDEASPFVDEARLVHALWTAWRARLAKNHWQDLPLQITDGLRRSLDSLPRDSHLYLAGFVDFTRAELDWIKTLQAQGRLTLVLQGRDTAKRADPAANFWRDLDAAPAAGATSDAYVLFLDRAFALNDGSLSQRAQEQQSASQASPARGRLTIHEAADA